MPTTSKKRDHLSSDSNRSKSLELLHRELIASLFMEIDGKRAANVLQKYHNKHLRLKAEDSTLLKRFVELNDCQYIRLMRALFYFSGMRMRFLPMKAIYTLR